MAGRNPFLSISPEDLKAIARQATSEHMSQGTNLTDAVVKAASLLDRDLTSEHVRRVCEMAYHDVFERKFRDGDGTDRFVSFDPPDASEAAGRLRAEKVASAQTREAVSMVTAPVMDKVASVSALSRTRRHEPVNAFSALIKEASPDPSEVLWYNPASELCYIRDQLKEAVSDLETRRATLSDGEKYAMLELEEQAMQAYKDGAGTSAVLNACVSAPMSKEAQGFAHEVMSTLAYRLASHGCRMENEKVASLGNVNPRHPLPQKFAKVASLRSERVHVELGLQELRKEWDRVNEEIRELLS